MESDLKFWCEKGFAGRIIILHHQLEFCGRRTALVNSQEPPQENVGRLEEEHRKTKAENPFRKDMHSHASEKRTNTEIVIDGIKVEVLPAEGKARYFGTGTHIRAARTGRDPEQSLMRLVSILSNIDKN